MTGSGGQEVFHSPQAADFATTFLATARQYLIVEYPTKLRVAVTAIPADLLWHRASPSSNSAGNLLLHMNGNVRQWILSGIAGFPDTRDRDDEFSARAGATAMELLGNLDETLARAGGILTGLPAARLWERRQIQGRTILVMEAIFHVVEHFAYHLGQIVWLAKMHSPGALHFYDDTDGLAVPLWPQLRRERRS